MKPEGGLQTSMDKFDRVQKCFQKACTQINLLRQKYEQIKVSQKDIHQHLLNTWYTNR